MALELSGYQDPGTYIGEVVNPAQISLATVPDVLAIVAHGNRSKRSTNEAVKRGQVFSETLTVAGVAPHTATLGSRGDRRVSNTTVRRTLSGETIELPDSAISFGFAVLTGSVLTTVDISTAKAFGFKMDNGQEITIQLEYNMAASTTISGSLVISKHPFSGVAGASATPAEIATAINAALVAATTLGYGTTYAAAVTVSTNKLVFTSILTTPYSDVYIVAPFANSGTAVLGFTVPAYASTIVTIATVYYNVSATYEIDYVAVNTSLDPLTNTATKITRTGSFANVTSFYENTDYLLTTGDIDWSPDTAASFTGSPSENFDLSTNDNIRVAFDGKAAVTIDLNNGALAGVVPGYAVPVAPAATTAEEVVNNINAVIAIAANYGPKYRACAVTAATGTKVKLVSPTEGIASSIELSAPTSLNATAAIFGLIPSQLPYTVLGLGSKPGIGVIYFITYDYDRPTADYNNPKRYFSEDQMTADLTPVSMANILSTYGQITFENGAPSVVCCQVNDLTLPGFPTVNEIKSAIDALAISSVTTDVVVADTRLNVQTYLVNHIEVQSSPTEKNYRSGWFGMPTSTLVGDKDTPDTFVYRAAVTLQVAPDSPARGRMILVAPSGVDRTISLEDGSQLTLTMNSTALCCAIAARHTSFTSPAISLANKTITGFDATTFPIYLKAERAQLASNGVMVVTMDGGNLRILDPVTTEAGGGAASKFMYRETASQKDNVSRLMDQIISNNLQGVVPTDLSDFVFDIKVFVAAVLTSLIETGAIGPFRDANGVSRDIDLSKDVQAEQSKNDPTKFNFRYWFFLRYPALRFMGQFSTDNPFFNA